MAKVDRTKVFEDVGVVSNAPIVGGKSKGYGFITLDDDTTIYVNKDLVKAAKMTHDDVGEQCRVRYQKVSGGRFIALRVYVLRDAGGEDQQIADLLEEIDDRIGEIDDRVQTLYEIMKKRGCQVPEFMAD